MVAALVSPGGRIAEVGVFEGSFAAVLLEVLRPEALLLVDPWEGVVASGDEHGNGLRHVDMEEAYARVRATLGQDPRVCIARGYSAQVLPGLQDSLQDGALDAVYLDGDHSYAGVAADLRAVWDKVKPGGWIMGHDYEMNMEKALRRYDFGVKRAVDEFLAERGLALAAKGMDGCVSFAFRKPG